MKNKNKKKPKLLMMVLLWLVLLTAVLTIATRLFPLRYEPQIRSAAAQNDLPVWTVAALIKAESNFNPYAKSHQDAYGLMQLREDTALWHAEQTEVEYASLLDPVDNINLGCGYLRYLLDSFDNDLTLALAAYNAGEGNVRKWLEDPACSADGKALVSIPFPETQRYIKKIYFYRWVYQMLYG